MPISTVQATCPLFILTFSSFGWRQEAVLFTLGGMVSPVCIQSDFDSFSHFREGLSAAIRKTNMQLSPNFKDLGLISPLLNQLENLNYTTPSPIQAASIPILLQKKDMIGLAQTGTGKTAAFALPLIHNLSESPIRLKPRQVRSLILSPTRELAQQILANIISYGKQLNISATAVFGGVGYRPQINALGKGVDILVATPGRLVDLLERKSLSLSDVETLILDEADRMLDMGFLPSIRKILSCIPQKRHTQLFSATMPSSISSLAKDMLHNPETVMITPPTKVADKVEQSLCYVDSPAEKREKLVSFLPAKENSGLTLLFTRTKHGANKLASFLNGKGFMSSALHGGKLQSQRDRLMKNFRQGTTPILVATDIAARGIDVKNIDLVINYDLPMEPESYIHRIGRTARANASGKAISFCSSDEIKYAKRIHRLLGSSIPLHSESNPVPVSMEERPARPVSGNRRRRQSSNSSRRRSTSASYRR